MNATTWEESADNYKHTSIACPRSRWIPDADVNHCEHPGCTVTFGKFGLPGLSIFTQPSAAAKLFYNDSPRSTINRTATTTSSWSKVSREDYFSIDASTTVSPTFETFTPGLQATPSLTPSSLSSQSRRRSEGDWSISLASVLSIKLHRRHHCRRCGSCFCDSHSSRTATVILKEEDYEEMRKGQNLPLKKSDASVNDWSRSIHARVCDMCYTLCQKAKHQYEKALCQPRDNFTLDPNSVMERILVPVEAMSPTGESLVQSKETMEEAIEYIQSKVRIYKETQRHHREGIKLLCNDLAVSRIAASTIASKGGATETTMCDVIAVDPVIASDRIWLEGAPHWDEGLIRRREKEVAIRAMSLEAFERHVRSQVLPFLRWDLVDEAEEEDWMGKIAPIVERSKQPRAVALSQRRYSISKTRASTLPPPITKSQGLEQHLTGSVDAPGEKKKQLGLPRILEHQQQQEMLQQRLQQQQQHRASSPIKNRTKGVRATAKDT